MRRIFWAIVLLLAAVGSAQAGRHSSCEPRLLAHVPLQIDEDGAVLMPATLAGREVLFELTFASGLMIFDEAALAPLGLTARRRNSAVTIKAGDTSITHYVDLQDLSIGGFKLQHRPAPVMPRPAGVAAHQFEGRIVAGWMSATLLHSVDAELDLGARQLELFGQFDCRSRSPVDWGGQVVEWPARFDEAGALKFTLELEGRKIEAGLLNGERVSRIDARVTREFFGFDENSAGLVSEDSDGNERAVFHAMSLTGAHFSLPDARVRLANSHKRCELTGSTLVYGAIGYADCVNAVPFTLGTDLVSRLRIYFSRARMTLFVTPANR